MDSKFNQQYTIKKLKEEVTKIKLEKTKFEKELKKLEMSYVRASKRQVLGSRIQDIFFQESGHFWSKQQVNIVQKLLHGHDIAVWKNRANIKQIDCMQGNIGLDNQRQIVQTIWDKLSGQ